MLQPVGSNWTSRVQDTLPTGQFTYCFAYWTLRLLVILPTGQFAYWTVRLLDILPTAWTVCLQIAHFA